MSGSNSSNAKDLLLLFDRPQEPIFVPKGKDNVYFDIPNNFLTDRYKDLQVDVVNRFGENATGRVEVNDITPPDLTVPLELDRREPFSFFLPKHQRIAAALINIFMGAENVDKLKSLATYCRDRVNPYLFNYCFSVTLLHRPDTQHLELPSIIQTFPGQYFDSKVFARAREEAFIVSENERMPIEIPMDYTASDLEPEHRVAYWREDLGMNVHHWHWHLIYPTDGARNIVAKDRRGEIFFYSHQQMIARYNYERLCNQLPRVVRFTDWKSPIPEGYFPKLDSLVSSRSWPARVPNATLSNLSRAADQVYLDVDDMIRWRDRIFEAIHSGFVVDDKGNRITLDEDTGIDVVGNVLDSSILSPNRQFYGNLHSLGHVILSYIHDPDNRHLEPFGVMGDFSTTGRDPIFYRWHAFVDNVFQQFKETLPRYSPARRGYQGISVQSIEIQSENGPKNVFNTFWQQSDVDISRGIDFTPRGSLPLRITHLQHEPFTYRIQVNNSTNQQKMGTCRIYMAPKFDERGAPFLFRDQRILFIELDKFAVTLRQGMNTITRQSSESNVTVPFERTFRNLDNNRPTGGDALEQFNYCGCGWPDHLLIPKGTPEGYPSQLFVMISNIEGDRVQQELTGVCDDAASYCGIKSKKYPDARSMGYPFDRAAPDNVSTLQEFLTPNMGAIDVTIKFSNRTLLRPGSQPNAI